MKFHFDTRMLTRQEQAEDGKRESFAGDDLYELIDELKLDPPKFIFEIYQLDITEGTVSLVYPFLKDVIQLYQDVPIICNAYTTDREELLPPGVLNSTLRDLGFVSINKFVGYEERDVLLYRLNTIGESLYKAIKERSR